jgi:hypothetical protein
MTLIRVPESPIQKGGSEMHDGYGDGDGGWDGDE